jgi:DNA gyrase subunit A
LPSRKHPEDEPHQIDLDEVFEEETPEEDEVEDMEDGFESPSAEAEEDLEEDVLNGEADSVDEKTKAPRRKKTAKGKKASGTSTSSRILGTHNPPVRQAITETLEHNYMPYAMSVILSRAIPEIDGFKPSHRKLLYTMYKMKLLDGPRTKSANVVGQTMKLNPHGDQAIYATMVRLTRGYDALLQPYVDSKGNFGKVTSRDMRFAASRYTEVKLDGICHEIFRDIDKDTVDFVDNYDGRMKEPTLLPTAFPNVLVSANRGIAVGMASNICSFNLREVCQSVIEYLKNPDFDVTTVFSGPDFPTGGYLLYDERQMAEIYRTGSGSFKLRAKYRYDKAENLIEIYEIPYTTTVEAILEKIVDLVKLGRVKEINDLRDETDLSGLKIALELKRGIDPDALMAKLYRYTTCEDSFSCNFNLLVDGRPTVKGIKGILEAWLRFRKDCIRRRLRYDLVRLTDKLHLLNGLKAVVMDIDRAIRIIRETNEDSQVVSNLMQAFAIDEVQANFVADIKLRHLNREYVLERLTEAKSLEEQIEKIKKTLENEKEIDKIIISEQQQIIKKYAKDRKTEVVRLNEVRIHEEKTTIDAFPLKLFLTEHGYLKKVSMASLRMASSHKLKDEDRIVQALEGTNGDDILFFTDKCQVYKFKAHELDEHKASTLGHYVYNLIEMEADEKVLFIVNTSDYSGEMVFAFENGKVAKVPLKSYETKTYRKKLVKAYADESRVVGMYFTREGGTLFLVRRAGADAYTALSFDLGLVTQKAAKNTVGIQCVRLKKGSHVDYAMLTEPGNEVIQAYLVNSIPASGKVIDPMTLLGIREKLEIVLKEE